MNPTNETVEMMLEQAAAVERDTNVQPTGALRPDVLLVCANLRRMIAAYTEAIEDAKVILRDNDRLKAIEAAAKDIAEDNDLMDDPDGWYGYAVGVGQIDRLKAVLGV